MITSNKTSINRKAIDFIFDWHRFPIDFWWRKKYNIPFGSSRHREMNFIDMLIEYQEELLVNRILTPESLQDIQEDEELGLGNVPSNTVPLSQEDIDRDYENLDLEQFDK